MPDLTFRTAIRRSLVAISLSTLALVARAETETTNTPEFEQCKQVYVCRRFPMNMFSSIFHHVVVDLSGTCFIMLFHICLVLAQRVHSINHQ